MNETTEVFDRRSATRVTSLVPVKIRYERANRQTVMVQAHCIDVSENGLSILTRDHLPMEIDLQLEVHFSGSENPVRATARVVSKAKEPVNGESKFGLRLLEVAPEARRALSTWLSNLLLSSKSFKDRRFNRSIESTHVSFANARGDTVVGFIDLAVAGMPADAPIIVISPGFGETKTNALSLAYILVTNGFRVLRYDATNHIGESSGTIVDCTLSKMKEDLAASVDFVTRRFNASTVGIVVSSLSAVVGFSIAAEDPRVAFVGGLVPVVNVKHTLQAVYNEDLVGDHISGKRWGLIDMLGFPIDADRFLSDAVDHEFHSLEATRNTIERIKVPVWCLVGSEDPWVLVKDVRSVLPPAGEGSKGYVVIESSMHQLHENPLASRTALVEIANAALRFMTGAKAAQSDIVFPRLREVAIQSRVEKERRKLISNNNKEEDLEFWKDYLSRFLSIIRVPDFHDFYQTIQRLSGPIDENSTILDAGCGNGSYGLWLLEKQVLSRAKELPAPVTKFSYIGFDFVSGALSEARKAHSEALSRFQGNKESPVGPHFSYVLADLDHKLPFLDNYVDKICCNLVLSYVRHPQHTLQEFFRILAPGGVLVITSLKPYADLSVVYRNFLEKEDTPEAIAEAKQLLANAGLIRARESEGHFKFFSEAELMGMMLELGAKNPTVVRSFANQANIAVMRKE